MLQFFARCSIACIALLALSFMQGTSDSHAATLVNTIHVATVGENFDGCGSPETPCKTIQHAINRAANDEWIKIFVAGGIYTDDPSDYNVCEELQIDAVVCNVNKRVEMTGGYALNNWSESNPDANPTIIDGQNQRRGVMVLNVSSSQNRMDIDGFIIRNGRGPGIPRLGGDQAIFGFGGGMFVDAAGATLKNVRFEDNLAVGDDQTSGHGGAASGGGLAVRNAPDEVQLENLVFVNNRAEGGDGVIRGGYAIGGGFYSYGSRIVGHHIVAENNVAQAGRANGRGKTETGAMSDAQGGGLAFQIGSSVHLEGLHVTDNEAIGGSAPTGLGGGAFGGGIFAEQAHEITLRDMVVRGNLAQGGEGVNNDRGSYAGHARGGGIEIYRSPAFFERFSIIENTARGGASQVYRGGPGGGGISLATIANHQANLINGLIVDNRIEMGSGPDASLGGGGGGLWVQGVNTTLNHCTIARNTVEEGTPLQGPAMVFVDTAAPWFEVVLENSIVAQHQTSEYRPAIEVKVNTALRLANVLFAENSGHSYVNGASVTGLETERTVASVGFVAPGSPTYDYRLQATSSAVDGSPSSTLSTDRVNASRDGMPDTGAYEYTGTDAYPIADLSVNVTASSKDSLYVSWDENPLATSYRMTVTCSGDAAWPAEGPCNVPFSPPTDGTNCALTRLTPYATYVVSMEALNRDGTVVAESRPIEARPTDHFTYIPVVFR